jgi:phage terminase small subunit
MEELQTKYPDYSLRDQKKPSNAIGKRKGVVRPEQDRAILLKVEEKLNNAQIARMVSDKYGPITAHSVGRWWGKPHIKRAMKRQQERYNEEQMPALVLEMNEGREEGVKIIKRRMKDPDSSLSEITNATKFFSQEVEKAKIEIIEEDDNFKAKETLDDVWEKLTPEARVKLALAYSDGKDVEITADDITDVMEAEVVEDDDQSRDSTTGINQEAGT